MAKSNSGPSAHLSWRELACKDGTEYPQQWRETRAQELAACFEELRALTEQPLVVLSAYRTPTYNRKIGGARFSQHMEGSALDLRPPKGWTVKQLGELAATLHKAGLPINGIGYYPTFLHIDIRPSNRLVVWHGGRLQN